MDYSRAPKQLAVHVEVCEWLLTPRLQAGSWGTGRSHYMCPATAHYTMMHRHTLTTTRRHCSNADTNLHTRKRPRKRPQKHTHTHITAHWSISPHPHQQTFALWLSAVSPSLGNHKSRMLRTASDRQGEGWCHFLPARDSYANHPLTQTLLPLTLHLALGTHICPVFLPVILPQHSET